MSVEIWVIITLNKLTLKVTCSYIFHEEKEEKEKQEKKEEDKEEKVFLSPPCPWSFWPIIMFYSQQNILKELPKVADSTFSPHLSKSPMIFKLPSSLPSLTLLDLSAAIFTTNNSLLFETLCSLGFPGTLPNSLATSS